MNQLVTKINKGEVTALCADAISELERAARLFPMWPDTLYPVQYGPSEVAAQLKRARYHNETEGLATGHSIFGEEYMEFLEAAMKPGNIVASRRELVQSIAMLLRIGCHLNDFIAKANLSAEDAPQAKHSAVASKDGTPDSLNRHEEPPRLGCAKGYPVSHRGTESTEVKP